MTKFPSLHLNSEYSLLESSIKIDSLISWAKEEGLDTLVLTDHNVMFGVADFVMKCKKNNIKPVIGLDLDVEDYRLILLAKDYAGYQQLVRLSSRKVRKEEIKVNEINTSSLYVIDHPTKGHFITKGRQLILENYFVGTTTETFANAVWVTETKILHKAENKALDILQSIKNGGVMSETLSDYLPHNPTGDMNDSRIKQALVIANSCNVVFPNDSSILPKFATPHNMSSPAYFKQLIQEGANRLLKDKDNMDVYLERIKYEAKIIEELGFTDYFLIIWDLIIWARTKGISVGPGRGSAAGSLISYLLGITEVDPIQFGLLFERFLNPQRVSMPDIDIDIQDTRRDEIITYLFEKYGYENVGLISTFQRLGAKMAIRDSAKALKMPLRDADTMSKAVPVNNSLEEAYKSSATFRALVDKSDEYTELYRTAKLVEGLPRQQGTHAAGIVISSTKLTNKVPTINGYSGFNQVQYTMDYLEDFNLLKIDLLGLRNLTILQRIQEEVYENYKKRVDLKNISYNDQLTNDLLSRGDTNGIFQLESYGMRKTVSQVGISSLDDVVAIISLYRPGPMDNIPLYASRKNKKVAIEKVAPAYDKILESTYGIIIYQEQIMHIAQDFAGMSFAEADILRRAISKKKNKLIQELKQKFFEGAQEKGNSIENIEKVFALIEKFANYGFNKSHAVAYSILAYRLAFLKARFPFEFYTALIEASVGSQTSVRKYVNEAKAKKIVIIPPNINNSQYKVINKDKKIVLPLTIIKGFGEAANKKVLSEREKGSFADFFDFVARVRNAGVGESTILILIQAGALREFGNTQTLIDSLPSATRYANMITITTDGVKTIDMTIIVKPRLIEAKRDIMQEVLFEEKLFGFQMSAFMTSGYETDTKITDIARDYVGRVALFIEKVIKMKDKNGNQMARVHASDSTNRIEIMVFAGDYKFISETKTGTIVEASIKRREFNGKDSYTLVKPWKELNNG